MSINYKKLSQCRACNSDTLQTVLSFGETPIADDYKKPGVTETLPLTVGLCTDCGLLQLQEVVEPGAIYDDYIYWSTSSPGLDKHFADYAESTYTRLNLDDASQVMDIGCNDGMLLKHFKEKGCHCFGVEPAGPIAQHARGLGLNVVNAYWTSETSERVIAQYGKMDLVTSNNVFANVDDIIHFTQAVSQVLNKDGVFVIETGYHLSLIDNFVFDNIYHEHLSYFSVTTLQRFFEQFGMRVFHAEHVPTKGGSIRVFACLNEGRHQQDESVGHMIAREQAARLFSKETYTQYSAKIDKLKFQIHSTLDELQNQGVKIIGFGASATVTTVLYVFDIGKYMAYLVDDNPIKHDTLSPGHGLAVKPSQALQSEENCCVVILPWRFADMYIAKNTQMLEQGGRFLKIMPEVDLIQ